MHDLCRILLLQATISSNSEVISLHSIDIYPKLIDAGKSECNDLDFSATAPSKIFPPSETCDKILEHVKEKQIARKVRGRSVHVTLPGPSPPYLRAPCVAIPIKTKDLPTSLTTRTGQNVAVDWAAGTAWEILQDVKLAVVHQGGGALLLLYLEC